MQTLGPGPGPLSMGRLNKGHVDWPKLKLQLEEQGQTQRTF